MKRIKGVMQSKCKNQVVKKPKWHQQFQKPMVMQSKCKNQVIKKPNRHQQCQKISGSKNKIASTTPKYRGYETKGTNKRKGTNIVQDI